jgi:hypothetical protein
MSLRFWNYHERFGLAYDQAHDALVARSALSQGKLPLLGPFSSAGPFQTSGTWYWLIMAGTAIYPQSVLSPWVYLTFICSMLIVCMGYLGKWLENERFGLLLASLTAVSAAQIAQSTNLTNQTPIAIFSLCALMCAFWYLKTKRIIAAFGMALFASWAASIHLQGVSLGILVILTLIFSGIFSIRAIGMVVLGAIPPMLPVFIYDMSHKFINIKNMIYYYTKDQYNISLDVLGRRWLTYISEYWPKEWAHIIGGNKYIAIILAVSACGLFIYYLIKRKIQIPWIVCFITFGCMVTLIRYTRVPLYSSFIVFTHPFVLLISAWAIYKIITIQKTIGWILLVIVLAFSVNAALKEVNVSGNSASKLATNVRRILTVKFPDEKFSLYDWSYISTTDSLPIVLYLEEQGLISETGHKIGVIRTKEKADFDIPIIATFSSTIVDLSASGSSQLFRLDWHDINPDSIYHETEEWQQ